MAKLEGAERQRMLDVFAQSDAIHRLESRPWFQILGSEGGSGTPR